MLDKIRGRVLSILSGQLGEDIIKADSLPPSDSEYLKNSPRAVGFESTQEQMNLFLNLLFGYNPDTDNITDVGAGRADLYGFIKDFYGVEPSYYGFEQNPMLVDAAAEKWGVSLDNRNFNEMAELPQKNWVVANAFFFQRRHEKEDEDLNYLLDAVDKMYKSASTAVSFNLLSPINNEIHDGHFYVHPGLILDMMIEKYQLVSIKHNYSNSIYTVTIYKF